MSDEQLTAEELDPDEIGDDPSGDLDYPPDRYQGALDPTNVDGASDSVVGRTAREVPDVIVEEDVMGRPQSEDERPDASTDLEGEIFEQTDLSAEEVAMHLEE
jgi:hypothetical protein